MAASRNTGRNIMVLLWSINVNHTFVYDKPLFSTSPLKERPSDPAIILINNCDLAVISQVIQLKWTSPYLSKKPAMKKPVKNMEYQTAECDNYPRSTSTGTSATGNLNPLGR